MAVVLAFRVMIALAPAAVKASRYLESDKFTGALRMSEHLKRLMADSTQSDEYLTELLQKENEGMVRVTTITGDFEVRRVQLEFTQTGTSVLDEDDRVVTFHHIKLSGGAPISTWDPADFTALIGYYRAWWGTIRQYYHSQFIWQGLKVYKAGPNIVPPQPPVYESMAENLPGQSNAVTLPPQVALSVTEKAGVKKNWGRFYLPAPSIQNAGGQATMTVSGRPATTFMTDIADVTDTMYEAALTGNKPFVVYRPLLPAGRPHKGSTELPERPANAQTVEQIQVDDVYDVIRSRRWEVPTLRVQRAIGGAAATTLPAAPPTEGSQAPESDTSQATSEGDGDQAPVQSP